MQHRLITLDQRTYLVPEDRVPLYESHETLAEFEVDPEEALTWQKAQLNAAVQRIGTLTSAMEHLLAGGSAETLGVAVDTERGKAQVDRARRALKTRGGIGHIKKAWTGPSTDALVKLLDRAMSEDE
ncbi:MAG: hypothetical protein AB8H79_16165 [Myxococcota bacterium]